ncbi:hypothetical protein [Paludibaculum fermentans]|uniref:Uncharacterized protein n=1 Tax=Paludibaculum fermentans TaxID=1473598 RepID=A0A7S7SP97_PALFE|nr:hypothetical protein [Paludibaculum fermentans]QOY92304.1 hypothetical protein IRI77_37800 [Paludibaculum fermentans]
MAQFNSYRYTAGNKFANFPDFVAPTQPEPAKNECVQDPFWFDNTVCKLTDVMAQWNTVNPKVFMEKIPVSRWTTENADRTLYYTQVSSSSGQIGIYRTSDNSLHSSPRLTAYEGQEFRWSDTDPKLMYYIPFGTCRFASYNVDSRKTTILKDYKDDYPECTMIRNDTEGTSSIGSRYWAWMVLGAPRFTNTRLLAIVVYDMETNKTAGVLDEAKFVAQGGNSMIWKTYGVGGRPNMVDIAPSNDRVLLLWPPVTYPAPENALINAAKSKVAAGKLTVNSLIPFPNLYDIGDVIQLRHANGSATGGPGCSGAAGEALTGQYTIQEFPDPYTAVIDISSSGLGDGTYTCSYMNPAITSLTVSGGTATLKMGSKHWMDVGRNFTLFNTPDPALNGKASVAKELPDARTIKFTVPAAVKDGTYTTPMMYYRDGKKGSALPDTNTAFPAIRPPNAANDGAHVYNLDFSHPVRVSNGQPHTGWAWDLNGDPVLLQQVSQPNWSGAQVDSFGFTNIYTGVYTPLFLHADFNYEATAIHQSRFYDRSIRGWGLFKLANRATAKSPIRNQVLLVELKHYKEHPEIWRVGYLHNDYGCTTTPASELFKINGCNPSKPYDTEAQLSLSRDGLSYYWAGLWPNGNVAINVYRGNIPLRVKTKGSFAPASISRTSAVISYIAPTADSKCTVTTSANANYSNPVEANVQAGGDSQLRTVTVGASKALTPNTRYFSRISCAWNPADPAAVSREEIAGSFTTSGDTAAQGGPKQ